MLGLRAKAPELFDAGVGLVRRMDRRFYNGAKNSTVMSVRDVIYITRSAIPRMVRNGITGLTIGSNGADFPPQVPKLHRWVDAASGTDMIVAYHPYLKIQTGTKSPWQPRSCSRTLTGCFVPF